MQKTTAKRTTRPALRSGRKPDAAATARADPAPVLLGGADAVVALSALAQETRLAIFRLLVQYAPLGRTPGSIAEALDLAPATLSFHLKELATAGLAIPRREGRNLWYRANVPAVDALIAYLTEHCCQGDGAVAAGTRCCPTECATPTPDGDSR